MLGLAVLGASTLFLLKAIMDVSASVAGRVRRVDLKKGRICRSWNWCWMMLSHQFCNLVVTCHFCILICHDLSYWYSFDMAVCQNPIPLVNIKIAGKWMFIPLKMVCIGIDPYPYVWDSHWVAQLMVCISKVCWCACWDPNCWFISICTCAQGVRSISSDNLSGILEIQRANESKVSSCTPSVGRP